MHLHEFQAKLLLNNYGISIPVGIVVETIDQAVDAATKIKEKTNTSIFVIKAQVHAGGRGKGGGVVKVNEVAQVKEAVGKLLGMNLITTQTGKKGKTVRKVLIQEDTYYNGLYPVNEFYLSIVLNKQTGENTIVYSKEGGVEIESTAAKYPEKIFTEVIDFQEGIQDYQLTRISDNLGLTHEVNNSMQQVVKQLYKAYLDLDATLIEINPLVKTSDNKILAADAKISIDANALYRHPELIKMRDMNEEEPLILEAEKHGLILEKYTNGNIACIVNGIGLAKLSLDMVNLSGLKPANYIDLGNEINLEKLEKGIEVVLKDKDVEVLFFHLFDGILSCDKIVNGIKIALSKKQGFDKEVIVKIQKENKHKVKEIIQDSGIKIKVVPDIEEIINILKKIN